LVLRFVAVDELPVNAAVIVPALKFPLPSRSTIVEAVFAVAYAIDDVTVVAEAATGNWPVVMPEIAAVVLGHPDPSARQWTSGTPLPFKSVLPAPAEDTPVLVTWN
jgi:hypothetical protein